MSPVAVSLDSGRQHDISGSSQQVYPPHVSEQHHHTYDQNRPEKSCTPRMANMQKKRRQMAVTLPM